jgi:threonine dehydrogenase-like Zn-dependent dehydrogenase
VQCENKRFFGGGYISGDLVGGQSEYTLIPRADYTLEHIPDELSDEQAIFVGDILSAAFFGAERAMIRPGDTVAVVGVGPVGLLAIQCADLFGPSRIFAVDMVDARLELAEELGAIPINTKAANAEEAVKAATGEHGVDASLECVGHPSAIDSAIHLVRGGGTISIVGMPTVLEHDFPYMRMFLKDLTVRGGWANVQGYMRPLLDLIAAGKLRPDIIISHRMKLAEAPEAYRMFDAKEATKVVLTPN